MLELKRAFTDGATHVLFEPKDFITRLAALLPRAHLLRYHGLFAPNALKRRFIAKLCLSRTRGNATDDDPPPRAPMSWMTRLRRAFDIDISRCPVCNGILRVIAVVTEPVVIWRIIERLDTRGKALPRQPASVVHQTHWLSAAPPP